MAAQLPTREKTFGSARSMTSTFLTINFSMLYRFVEMFTPFQANIQVQSVETGIDYPQNKCKDGRILYESHSLQEISDAKIYEAIITRAKINAKPFIEKLGMADLLHKNKMGYHSYSGCDTDMHDSDDEDDEDQTDQDMESVINLVVQEVCTQKIPRQLKLT